MKLCGRRSIQFGALYASVMLLAGQPLGAQQYHPQTTQSTLRTAPTGTPVEVYRGAVSNWTPVWIELADLGNRTFVLTALDGLDVGDNPPERYVMRSNGKSGASCALTSVDGAPLTINGCPTGTATNLRVNLRGIKGAVRLVPVGIDGALGYGQVAGPTGSPVSSCALPTMSRSDLLPSGQTSAALAQIRLALAAVPQPSETSTGLDALRRDRLRAVRALLPTAWEQDRLNYIDSRINRMFDFRYRGQLLQEKQQFEAEMANRPERVQARNRIGQIDAQLERAYDPVLARQKVDGLMRFRAGGHLTALDRAFASDLDQSTRLALQQAILAERALGELNGCANTLAPDQAPNLARAALDRQFQRIAQSFDRDLNAEIDSGLRSSALQSRLAEYRSSPGLTAALAAAGRSGIWTASEGRIAALASREASARNAEAQAEAVARQRAAQAAAAAETARLAISGSGANPPTDGDILNVYVGYLAQISQSTSGAVRLQRVPGSRFELSTRGAMGGQLWRVRFDVAGKRCTRAGAGSYDCSFTIRNSFSNARDGSFEAGMMAFSDGLMGLIFGRDAEGITGRLQSNNVNRLLMTDQVPMNARFVFTKGQFQSLQVFEKVWDNTMIRIPSGRR